MFRASFLRGIGWPNHTGRAAAVTNKIQTNPHHRGEKRRWLVCVGKLSFCSLAKKGTLIAPDEVTDESTLPLSKCRKSKGSGNNKNIIGQIN